MFIKPKNEPSRLRIYDALGDLVYNRVISESGLVTLKENRISQPPVGVYLLKVATGNRSAKDYKIMKLM
ncbi:MAG: T9SS type A sorting domain-containing protein [bacterium]